MKKMLGSLVMLIALSTATTSAFQLILPNFQAGDWLEQKFSLVHFSLPNVATNNFQGAFFWLPTTEIAGATQLYYPGGWMPVTFGGTTKYCSKQVRGLYYNNARGSRLWPLDTQTLNGLTALDLNGSYSYTGLAIQGGLYTTCGLSGSVDLRSIYGQIIYTGTAALPADYGSINAGFMYDPATNLVDLTATQGLYPTLQYFNNETPIGFIYDTLGGIGFVGGQMINSGQQAVLNNIENNTGSINSIFGFTGNINNIQAHTTSGVFTLIDTIGSALDTFGNIGVMGNVLFGRGGLDVTNRLSLLGHPINSSVVVFSDVTNTSDILNELRKNANSICNGEQWYNESNVNGGTPWKNDGTINQPSPGQKVLCIGGNPPSGNTPLDYVGYDQTGNPIQPVYINLNNPSEYAGLDIVVRGRNVVLQGSVPNTTTALNLFVDNGNLFLENDDFVSHVVTPGVGTSDETFLTFDANGNVLKVQGGSIAGVNNVLGAQTTPQIYDAVMLAGQTGAVNYGKYLRGNIFVNGIMAGWDGSGPSMTFNKYYMHGRLATLNTVLAPSFPRISLINNIFGPWDAGNYETYIDFNEVFGRSCELNGMATLAAGSGWPCQVAHDMFKGKAFVLISTQIPTRLYK